jgi:hypothetical protein
MFLKEFDTNKEKFNKIQSYLKENFKFEIAEKKLTSAKADRLIERSENRLKSIDQKTNPKEYSKLKLVAEGLKLWKLTEQEDDYSDDMDEARIILSAEEITTKLQDMVEKIAELQVQKLIPIVDKMKEELGPNEAARFNQIADSSLAELLDIAKSTKDKISTAIVQVSSGTSMMDQDLGMQQSQGLDSVDDMDDGFDGDDAVSGDIGPEGRRMKGESIDFEDALLSLKEATKDGKISRKDFNKIIGKK